jgi:hypothetical protein
MMAVFELKVPQVLNFDELPKGVLCGARANVNLSRAGQPTAAASHRCACPFCSFFIAPSPQLQPKPDLRLGCVI